MVGMGQKDAYVGDEAQARRPRQSSVMVGMGQKDAYVGDSFLARRPRMPSVMVGMGVKDAYVGDEAQAKVGGNPLDDTSVAVALSLGSL